MVDIIARKLKLDPVEMRKKNFIPADAFPYRNVTGALYDSGQYEMAMKRRRGAGAVRRTKAKRNGSGPKASIEASARFW